ncbi:MAG TPA: 50S ribosomal protein L3 [Nitrososphaerales archaeon]|nr:50S ribosomal protein L3 [Nitrososphaerales archaeon]
MGHRKHSAPRRGSLAYRPRGRAKSLVPRIRNWPAINSDKPTILGFPTFKAGTAHVITVDTRERTPNSGKPLFNLASVLVAPEIEVKRVRFYGRTYGYDLPLGETATEVKAAAAKIQADRISRIAALVSVTPAEAGLSQKKPIEFEVGVGGGDVNSQLEYASGLVGKKVKFEEVFKAGMYVDALGITKGKGFEGPVTRFGVKRKQHKSRKSVRAIGVLGPWHPAAVMYTAPRAGQRGFHQRSETGKRILIVGNSKDNQITPPGGFAHFGNVTGDYAVLRGSVPGPSGRMVVLRYPIRRKASAGKVPQVIEVSTKVRA